MAILFAIFLFISMYLSSNFKSMLYCRYYNYCVCYDYLSSICYNNKVGPVLLCGLLFLIRQTIPSLFFHFFSFFYFALQKIPHVGISTFAPFALSTVYCIQCVFSFYIYIIYICYFGFTAAAATIDTNQFVFIMPLRWNCNIANLFLFRPLLFGQPTDSLSLLLFHKTKSKIHSHPYLLFIHIYCQWW